MTSLAENLLMLRNEAGLNQETAAKKIGIAFRSYRRYEAGEREPVASVIVKIADYFGVTTDYLLGRTDQRT